MMDLTHFLDALARMPRGYSQGEYAGQRWGATLTEAAGGRRYKLFGEALGSNDFVSFNLYLTSDGQARLKPCEMPTEKVVDFVLGYIPDP